MKFRSFLVIVVVLVVLSIFSLWIILSPSLWSVFNLSSDRNANVATTIGGITGPLLTIISIYFIYEAYNKQNEALHQQSSRNDIDMIFALINDLNQEIERFEIRENRGAIETKFNGAMAIFKASQSYPKQSFEFFNSVYESDQLVYLIESYIVIKSRVLSAAIKIEDRETLNAKLESMFKVKFDHTYRKLAKAYGNKSTGNALLIYNYYKLISPTPL